MTTLVTGGSLALDAHPHDIEDRRPVVLVVGKKSLGKGTDSILAASKLVVQAIPNVLFVFIGRNTEYIAEDLPWVWNVPNVPQEFVRDWYEACWIVCHAPEGSDAAPRAVIDASLGARGVVGWAPPVGGMRELVTEGVTGYLVPYRDIPALAAALIKALDVDEAIRLGMNNYQCPEWRRVA